MQRILEVTQVRAETCTQGTFLKLPDYYQQLKNWNVTSLLSHERYPLDGSTEISVFITNEQSYRVTEAAVYYKLKMVQICYQY